MTRDNDSRKPISRRTILRSSAAASVAGFALPAAAQDTADEDANATDDDTTGGATGDGTDLFGEGPAVGLETVATEGLAAPITLQAADEEADRRFVVDQTGYIYVHDDEGLHYEEPFLDVSDQLVEFQDFDERGLLGLAFHPEFEENGRFYVRYSSPPREGTPDDYDHTFVLAEFTADDDLESADPDSERTILEIPEPQFNHNSGPIAFGPDGYLYVPTGDGGGGNDVGEGHVDDWYGDNEGGNGQDTEETLLGGVLRIDVDVEEEAEFGEYGIPEDNPLVDEEGHLDEYYAWGMRNPWGELSFTGDGEFLLADVGQELFESVNHVQRGGNYSWNVKEGAHCFSTDEPTEPPEDCPDSTPDEVRGGEELLDPVIEYPQEHGAGDYEADEETDGEPVGTTVVGGHLYEDGAIDDLEGAYVFGDWSQDGEGPGTLFVARPPEGWLDESDGDGGPEEDTDADTETDDDAGQDASQDGLWPIERLQVEGEAAEDGRPASLVYGFGRDADGELYVLTTSTSTVEGEGAVHRLVPADDAEAETETDDAETDDTDVTEDADDGPEVESEPETEEEAEADENDTESAAA